MKISKKGRYALEAMKEMAKVYKGDQNPYISVKNISEVCGIPNTYLEQIFIKLKKSGLIKSYMGVKGGYSLKRAPAEIAVLEIISAVDDKTEDLKCKASQKQNCEDENCSESCVWGGLAKHIDSYLGSLSLEKIISNDLVV